MNSEKEKHIPIKIPTFYLEVVKSWHLCDGDEKAPQDAQDIWKEIVWGNKVIQVRGKTLFFEHWKESNINFVDDLLNKDGKFKAGMKFLTLLQKEAIG